MDGVPFLFCEDACATLFNKTLPSLGGLSGYYGDLALSTYRNQLAYVVSVEDGVEKEGVMQYKCSSQELHTPEEIAAVPKNKEDTIVDGPKSNP
uniref:YHS domain-containing protein n=1 Tax=Steinernema glaseri TaxID=37863 RepID=A0A1I8A667_9BILA